MNFEGFYPSKGINQTDSDRKTSHVSIRTAISIKSDASALRHPARLSHDDKKSLLKVKTAGK